jgi:hypothetical protein
VVNRLVVVLAMVVFAFMPSDGLAAAGAPPLSDTGVRVPAALFSDGERLVGVSDLAGMRVLDAVTSRRGFVHPPPGCAPAGVGGGAVAFACPPPEMFSAVGGAIVDLRTGAVKRLAPLPLSTFGDGTATVAGVGRHWVRLRVVGYHYAVEQFVSRATGRPARLSPPDRPVGDPDARSVWQRLCAPLRQRSWDNPESGLTDSTPYVFRFPVGATISEPDPRRPHVDADNDPSRTIIVERCGRARPLLQRDCFRVRSECGLPAIAAGVVAWWEGRRLRAFLPAAADS